jgi:hypothetical protein
MARKNKKKWQLDPIDLQETVARSKGELEEARAELKKLGNELKRNHMRRMLHPEVITLTRDREDPRFNPMCRKCLNSCKQPESVKIFYCSKYDPVE